MRDGRYQHRIIPLPVPGQCHAGSTLYIHLQNLSGGATSIAQDGGLYDSLAFSHLNMGMLMLCQQFRAIKAMNQVSSSNIPHRSHNVAIREFRSIICLGTCTYSSLAPHTWRILVISWWWTRFPAHWSPIIRNGSDHQDPCLSPSSLVQWSYIGKGLSNIT